MILITWKIFQTEAWSGLYDPVEVVLEVPAGAGTPDATFWRSIIHDVTTMLILSRPTGPRPSCIRFEVVAGTKVVSQLMCQNPACG